MKTDEYGIIKPENSSLFDRVVTILEQARTNVVRTINNNMVLAYWLIGREIVQEIQGGEERAEYGKQLIEQLSEQLTRKYGRGFSTTNLRYFRTFFYGLFRQAAGNSPHPRWRIWQQCKSPYPRWRFG